MRALVFTGGMKQVATVPKIMFSPISPMKCILKEKKMRRKTHPPEGAHVPVGDPSESLTRKIDVRLQLAPAGRQAPYR